MPKFSVKKPYTIIVVVLAIILLGVVSFSKMTTELLPDISLPYVVVMTTAVGYSPEEVESIVTKPIEQSVATLDNVENIQSISAENYSLVILEFSDSVNMDSVTIDLRENLDSVSASWSATIGSPSIMKISMDMLPVMVGAIDLEGADAEKLTKFVQEEIVPKIEGVNGVASVSLSGEVEKTQQVVLNQEKIDSVNEIIREAILEQLEEAEEQLNQAQEELENGQKELEEKQGQLEDGQIAADQGLLTGKLELLKLEISMSQTQTSIQEKESQIATLESILPMLENVITQLDAQNSESQKQIDVENAELDKRYAQYTSDKASLEKEMATLQARATEIQRRLDELRAIISQREDDISNSVENSENSEISTEDGETSSTEIGTQENSEFEEERAEIEALLKEQTEITIRLAEITTEIASLELERTEIETRRAILEENQKVLNKSLETASTARTQYNSTVTQLNEARNALAEAQTALESGQNLVSNSKENLEEQETDTLKSLNEAQKAMEKASSQLSTAQTTLQEKLASFNISKEDALNSADLTTIITKDLISNILVAQNFSMPAGYVTEEGVSYLIRVGDELENAEELENLVLFDIGIDGIEPITLSDVADISIVSTEGTSYAKVNGNDGLVFRVTRQNTYPTAEVAHSLLDLCEKLEEEYPGLNITNLMDQGQYIDMVVSSVLENLIMGGILAIIILILFLKDIKPTFIIACSIPISVIFAIVLMYFSGVTLNIISLSGLAVGVGMLVDNSVVVIENIYRLRNKGASKVQAAVSGATQVAGAITASTLTTVCVFLPIVFVEGMTRQLFQEMALTIGYSLIASLIVALTLVPAMSSRMLTNVQEKKQSFFNKLINLYETVIVWVLGHRFITLVTVVIVLIGSAILAMSRGTAFLPESDSNQLTVSLTMLEDSKYEDTVTMADEVMKRVLSIDDVDTVGAMMDSVNLGIGTSKTSVTMYVVLSNGKKHTSQEIASTIEELCENLECEVSASGSSIDMSSLGGSGVSVRIEGDELDELQRIAQEVAEILKNVEGTEDISDGMEESTPEIHIVIDKDKAMEQGLTVAQIYMELATKLATPSASTTITIEGESYDTVVLESEKTVTLEDIYNYTFIVTTTDGAIKEVALADIASWEEVQSLSSINRQNQKRYISVSTDIADGYNVGLVGEDIEEALAEYEMPEGYRYYLEGENETINDALSQLVLMLLIGVCLIYFIMVAQFQSFMSPFIVMFTIPLAFTGGFLGLYLSGFEVSVVAMIGFIMLSGIVVNNGIVLVDYINQLRLEGVEKREAIIESGKTRMRPILMTAITTILGLTTMAFGVGMGADIMQPVAIVTIGGLTYATFMTLFVIPVMYDLLTGKKMKKISETELEILDL